MKRLKARRLDQGIPLILTVCKRMGGLGMQVGSPARVVAGFQITGQLRKDRRGQDGLSPGNQLVGLVHRLQLGRTERCGILTWISKGSEHSVLR